MTYLGRLCNAGMSRQDATIIIRDFHRENDISGLVAYIEEYERVAYVDKVESKSNAKHN